jgi:hypothetical protein
MMDKIIALIKENFVLLAFITSLLTAFVIFRTEPTSLADESAFYDAVRKGRPTVVEFYSNY